MKKVAGTLKIDQAQFRELEAFTKFGGDMDPVTAMTINKGQKNSRLLVQSLHEPLSVEKQVAILYCGTHGLLSDVPLNSVPDFQKEFLTVLQLKHQADVLDVIKSGVINDEVSEIIEDLARKIAQEF